MKLSEIQNETGFTDAKNARNLADWLRASRDFEPHRIDGEIAYPREFVVAVLQSKIEKIKKRYPECYEKTKKFIGMAIVEAEPEQSAPEAPNDIEQVVSVETMPALSQSERLRKFLTSSNAFLWGTILSLLIFLPFTALNLQQYIAMERGIVTDALCWFIAAIWDFSILLFALNGKKWMSRMGAFVMFVFVAAKFDFFARMLGDTWQESIVITFIVLYTPLLVHNFTELAVGEKN